MLAGRSFRSGGRSTVLKAGRGQFPSSPYFFPVFERREGGRRADESAVFIARGGRARTDQEAALAGGPRAGHAEEEGVFTRGPPRCLH